MITMKEKINHRYLEVGFEIVRSSEEFSIYKNKFSIHYVFFCGDAQSYEDKYSKYHDIFKDECMKGEFVPDIYWNFYEIYVFDNDHSDGFEGFKERTELDFQMSRKYVYLANKIDDLPPLHLSLCPRQRIINESPWEEEWKSSIGEDLYYKIMDTPKSRIEDIFKEYLYDNLNKD